MDNEEALNDNGGASKGDAEILKASRTLTILTSPFIYI